MLNIRSKGIHHYNKVLIVHCSCYHGYRKKEQPSSSIPKNSRLSRLCRGVQLYPHGEMGWTSISRAPKIRVASHLQPFPNPARVSHERFERVPGPCPRHSWPMPPPLPVSRINRSQLVTWLVEPIHDMWSVRVVTRTYVSQYTVLTAPQATSSKIPHSRRPIPRMSKISKLSSRLSY
jgi:hypothetical protein